MTRVTVLLWILAAAIGVGAVVAYNHAITRVAELEAANDAFAQRLATAEGKAAQLDRLIADKVQEEANRRFRRAGINRAVTEAANEDQSTADYLRTPIPDRLRDVWAGKGATRERAGSDGTDASRGAAQER